MHLHKRPVAPTRNAIMYAALEGKKDWERWARLLIS
jgi:hypothetical protein